MTDRFAHVLTFALAHPWAIEKPMLPVLAGILARHLVDAPRDNAAIEAALVNRKNLPQPRAGSLAVIPVYGVLAPRMNLLSDMSGGTTYEKLTAQIREAVAAKDIKTIVLDVDSPGGSVAGDAELATEIMRARTRKPVVAVAQYTMASAAYHLAAAATEIVAAPSARVGSIGTYTIHDDLSKAMEQLGVKRTYISAGGGKVDGNPAGPLSDEALARVQGAVDSAYQQFVANVVKGRGTGTSIAQVKNEWQAHVYSADEALHLGMVDRIATLDDTIARILTAGDGADQRAAAAFITATEATDQELPARAATSQEPESTEADLERQVFELQF